MASRVLTSIALGAVTLLAGCSAFRSYDNELQETNQQLRAGNLDAALTLLEKNNKGEDKDLLYYFEKGELLRAKGDLNGSQAAWGHADQVVGNWEDSVKLDTDKYLAQFGSFLVNDKVRRYEGYDYEKVMLTTQMAMNLLASNDFDGARMAIKKTHEREAVIAELRDKEYLQREDEAEKQGVKTEYKDLKGYPVEALDAPDVVNLKNSYQSAFSHYLAGFVYEALGEKDLAAPGYRKAAELRPNTPLLEQALLNLDAPEEPVKVEAPGKSSAKSKRKTAAKAPVKAPVVAALAADESDVLIVVQSGLAPARDSVRIPLPLPINGNLVITPLSFPVIKADTSTQTFTQIGIDGQQQNLTLLNSTTAMSRRALRDDMPGIILRTTVRAVTRGVAQKNLNEVNPLAGLAVGLASAVTEGADTRTWRTLPDNTQVARLRLKQGEHSLSLPNAQGGTQVQVKVDQRYQVIALRVVGNQVFSSGLAAHVIPNNAGQNMASNQRP
ncbi:COG3014 family protein [Pseudomonas idahonensis]|uniref:COG3014 family protein n=1 Tax=Pseudomonas idahonensis TaxID=2942628 RepID=UPI0035C119F2